jgi:glycosyltransferase involved in cell wall biosynthesis
MTVRSDAGAGGALRSPVYSDVGIIGLVYHHWGDQWLTPHHVLARLRRYYHVVWINPAHEWRQVPEILRGGCAGARAASVGPGFHIYRPEWWLPKLYRPRWLADFTFDRRLRRARRVLAELGCRKFVLYLWDYRYERALAADGFHVRCYHIEDEYSFSTVEVPIDPSEARVISSVDEVFIISPAMMEKKGKINPHTTLIPHGVDYGAYAASAPEPADLVGIPGPRIGYSGFLKKQLNWPLLRLLADRHPEWSFVFVGATKHADVQPAIDEMARLPNVHFLGAKEPERLAHYNRHFDVCIMPYQMDDYTKYIFPLKLYEYLASGRPVVGTPIRSLLDYAHVVRLASTPDEWSEALAGALIEAAGSHERANLRRSIARQNDWGVQIDRLAQIISARLDLKA